MTPADPLKTLALLRCPAHRYPCLAAGCSISFRSPSSSSCEAARPLPSMPRLSLPSIALRASTSTSSAPLRLFTPASLSAGAARPSLLRQPRSLFLSARPSTLLPSFSSALVAPLASRAFSLTTPLLGARGTEYQPSQVKRKRRHGFLQRLKWVSGRKILGQRRNKGRNFLSH